MRESKRAVGIVLALDADRAGMAFGGILGIVVMALSFHQGADAFEVVTRVGLSFLATYAATAFFVLTLVRTTREEILESIRRSHQSQPKTTQGQ